MGLTLTRRSFLYAAPFALYAQTGTGISSNNSRKSKPLPSVGEFTRITDGVTENIVVRLTSPAFTSRLTALGNQFVSVRERTLLFSSNRTGRMQPFQVDLRSGALKQIAEADKLDPRSLCLDHLQKSAYFLDGEKVRTAPLGKAPGKASIQTLAEDVTWFRLGADGALFVIHGGKLAVKDGADWKTIASPAVACWPQPGGVGCLFARASGGPEQEFWYATLAGRAEPLLLASGRVRDPYWDRDGQSVLFLRDVTNANGVTLVEIHRRTLTGEPEKCISPTTQFASFAPNGDSSVFVGASNSRAQPTVVLLLRSPNREMTLCEHASRHPGDVLPSFSPDSRRVYFESEREGNPAIYSVNVEYLVEPIAVGI